METEAEGESHAQARAHKATPTEGLAERMPGERGSREVKSVQGEATGPAKLCDCLVHTTG